MSTRHVAIIGGGASGLTALSELCQHSSISATLFEAREEVGGAWLYYPDPGECKIVFDEDGNASVSGEWSKEEERGGRMGPTPMYEGLRTNVPTIIMQYRDRPFSPYCSLFPGPKAISSYLQSFSESVQDHIRYKSRVTRLRHSTPAPDARKWTVNVRSTGTTKEEEELQFDAVIIANGHYTKPYIPLIPGLSTFPSSISHAKWYRSPLPFSRKNVLVVGNSASGYDVTRELAQQLVLDYPDAETGKRPHKIHQSIRSPGFLGVPKDSPDAPEWLKEIKTFGQILRVEGQRVLLENDTVLEDVDHIIFATGYLFSFPFALSTDMPFTHHPLTVPIKKPTKFDPAPEGGMRVHHLDDRQLFYLPDPTLSFLCLNSRVIPFPLAEAQAHFIASFLTSPSFPSPSFPLNPGTPEDADESRSAHAYNWPKEHDYQDALLAELGEGREEGKDGKWSKVATVTREVRMGANGLRRAVLGY